MGLRFIYSPTSLNVAPFSFRLSTLEGFLIYLASGHCLDFTASLLIEFKELAIKNRPYSYIFSDTLWMGEGVSVPSAAWSQSAGSCRLTHVASNSAHPKKQNKTHHS